MNTFINQLVGNVRLDNNPRCTINTERRVKYIVQIKFSETLRKAAPRVALL